MCSGLCHDAVPVSNPQVTGKPAKSVLLFMLCLPSFLWSFGLVYFASQALLDPLGTHHPHSVVGEGGWYPPSCGLIKRRLWVLPKQVQHLVDVWS